MKDTLASEHCLGLCHFSLGSTVVSFSCSCSGEGEKSVLPQGPWACAVATAGTHSHPHLCIAAVPTSLQTWLEEQYTNPFG